MSVPQHRITADGSSGFKAEAGRYHLYAGLFCPFASRAFTARSLKGLQDVVSITWVDPVKGEDGWRFTDKVPKCTLDTVNNCDTLRQVYQKIVPAVQEADRRLREHVGIREGDLSDGGNGG